MNSIPTLKERLQTLRVGSSLAFPANDSPTLAQVHRLCVQLRINLVPRRVGDDIRLERVA